MVSDIESQIAAGGVSPENPVVVFGYSQSTDAASQIMSQLAADKACPVTMCTSCWSAIFENPNGGFLNTFDFPAGNTRPSPSGRLLRAPDTI